MSESEKKETSVSNYLFENDYLYVTENGELYLKKTAYFKIRKIATLDPENLDQEIEEYREKFASLEERTETFLNQWKDVSAETLGQAEERFNEFKRELIEAEAVGDFESLVGKLEVALAEIKQQMADKGAAGARDKEDQKETDTDAVSEDEQDSGAKKSPGDESGSANEDVGPEKDEEINEKAEVKADEVESVTGKKPGAEVKPGDTEEVEAKAEEPTAEDEKAGAEAKAVTESEKETGKKKTPEDEPGRKPEEEKSVGVASGEDKKTEEKVTDPAARAEQTNAEEEAEEQVKTDAAATGEKEADDVTKDDEPEVRGEESEEEQEAEPEEETPEEYYGKLATKVEQLIELSDWPYVSMELSNIDKLWSEGPDPGEVDISSYRKQIDQAKQTFEERKEAHYEEQRKIKARNLEKKKNLLEELKKIISEENWTATKEVGSIRNKWDQIRPLPAGKEEEFQPEFDKLIAEFEDHKVDRLVKKKQKEEENLIGKLVVLDKMDGLLKSLDKEVKDWPDAEAKLEKLNKQWRKIGRVPIEKNQEVWDRFHDIQDRFHQLRFKHDKKYRQQIEKFLSRKKKLIKEAEVLIDDPDLAGAARNVNKLHRQWKKVGNLPQKDENELWDQFKAATDAFNDKKSDNLDQLREQEDQNLEEKKKLINEAEELKNSEEWETTHNKLQQLMKKWKKIGPVPKRKSGKIWKQFKSTMDVFYDRRREHFKEVKEDRKENLEEKQEILNKLKALKDHDNPIEAVEEAKSLQEEFKKAGYVPIKYKNKMWKEYRETCDVIYDRFRAVKSAARVVGKDKVSDFSTDDIAEIQKKQKEATRLRKEIKKTHNELIQMKESLSYFKPSGKGSSLLDEVHKKVEKTEDEIEQKEEKLAEIEKEIDQLKRDS